MTPLIAQKLSIIIVNYRSKKNLLQCLSSLKNFIKDIDCEVIIVNNDKEERLEEARKFFFEVKILEQDKNNGFGRACNLGAKEADGEILFFLNPDAEIVSGHFQEVFDEFSRNTDAGILGSQIVQNNGQTQPWIAGFRKNLWDLLKNNMGLKKSQKIWKASATTEADWVSATAMFVRKDLFDMLGGFDENIFMYFEDTDLCERTRSLGKKILYFPGFIVRHQGGASFENKKNQKKHYYASQEYYFKKHCKKWEAVGIKLVGKFFYDL